MGTYNVHAGHCPQGKGAHGAVGLLKESVENRKVNNTVISALKNDGHKVYNCTDDSNSNEKENLQKIVAKCNAHPVDLDVSIHLNAGGGTGVEVWCYDGKTAGIAGTICKNVSAALGIPDRGVKYSTGLYVLRSTIAPALLVECCFVDSQADYDRWNADKCGAAIASAIAGKKIQGNTGGNAAARPSKPSPSAAPGSDWVRRLQTECNAQGFSQQKADGIPGRNTLAGCPQLGKTSRGKITALMQERLIALGYSCGPTGSDGINGAGTQAAIKSYQKACGLAADGIVGPKTWSKLLGLS